MEIKLNNLKRISAKVRKRLYMITVLLKDRLFYRRRLNILFTKRPGFENEINKAFRFSRHQISFEEFSSTNINNADLVVPLSIHDLKYLNEVNNLVKNNPIPIPSLKSIALCDDKFLFNQTMLEYGFSAYLPKVGGTLTYPYILKKRIDDSSNNVHIISNSEQEQLLEDTISSQDYYCQEIIPGSSEYATHILIKDRKISHALNIEYVFNTEISIKNKDKENFLKISHCPYLDIFASMLNALEFEGICCVNYKEVGNRPFVFEINPRFGRSLCPFVLSFLPH